MRFLLCLLAAMILVCSFDERQSVQAWIRINQLGYQPNSLKVAVWCSKGNSAISSFQLIDAKNGKVVFEKKAGKAFGAYGPFVQTYRLDFSAYKVAGNYYLKAGDIQSPVFAISDTVYKGTADFCLRYMRQQRSGFNPYLKDSCHTHDGYVLYGTKAGIPDSTHFDVTGGWHDASDYLQYATTSANATYHLLAAYRDFPGVFTDQKKANGLDGKNGFPDILDEAKWGLDWLLKMHPSPDIMFNQIADDRDHISMRMPKQDSQYNRGYERPVYFIDGEPQQRGKFLNNTTGTSSTAAKFSSAFAMGSDIYSKQNHGYSQLLNQKAKSALAFSNKKLGVTQTVSVRSPYIYEEDNWTDDMELAYAQQGQVLSAMHYAQQEPVTPWLGNDTARHYQWYPFINLGHNQLAKQLKGSRRDTVIKYYRDGIERVKNKANQNAFYRGIPFIWCSNNLTTSFAIQCYWYRQLTSDRQFEELEQANFDWLFGCNPWGTSFVYGLPAGGDTPVDPHSAFTHLKKYPIDGGLVDGPVYGSIYNSLKGIRLFNEDTYAPFQSALAVYHDDYGDYSTNEPTMDGTASLIYLLAAMDSQSLPKVKQHSADQRTYSHVAITRGDSSVNKLALVFTGDEYAEGGTYIQKILRDNEVPATFFFTGRFYRNPSFHELILQLKKDGHYLGAHSNEHLLYCDWQKRDSLLVTKEQFRKDLQRNYKVMKEYGVGCSSYFLPPYEWYNDTIAAWAKEMGLQLINYTPGTLSHTDYTTVKDKNFRSSETIYNSIVDYEKAHASGLNGFVLLMHIGAGPDRADKFYQQLPRLISYLKERHYQLVRINELLSH